MLIALGVGYLVPSIFNLGRKAFVKFYYFILSKRMLKILIKCTVQEKKFLYYRVYENGNELGISMYNEPYFYKENRDEKGKFKGFSLYKKEFNTKEKVGMFLRELEKKGILRNGGNQSMTMPLWVWNVLVRNANKCFIGIDIKK